jgi:hypothetical protein
MILQSKTLAALVVAILFGGILISANLGWWQTESSKVAAKFSEGEFAGQANPADIRGSYTFGDVEKNFGVPATLLGQAFNVVDQPAAFQVKNLEAMAVEGEVEIGTASVRLFVAFYNNLPIDLSAETYLPQAAVALLSDRNLSAEQLAYLQTHTAGAPATAPVPAPEILVSPSPETSTAETSARIIKGKTTLGEILSWGLPKGTIEQIFGLPMPDAPSTTLKDFCSANSLDFETIKPALQAEVDKLK